MVGIAIPLEHHPGLLLRKPPYIFARALARPHRLIHIRRLHLKGIPRLRQQLPAPRRSRSQHQPKSLRAIRHSASTEITARIVCVSPDLKRHRVLAHIRRLDARHVQPRIRLHVRHRRRQLLPTDSTPQSCATRSSPPQSAARQPDHRARTSPRYSDTSGRSFR